MADKKNYSKAQYRLKTSTKKNTVAKKIDQYLQKRQADTKLPSQVYTPIDTTGAPNYKNTTTRKNIKYSPNVKPNEDMSNRATTYSDNKYPKYETKSSYVADTETPKRDFPESIVPIDTKSESAVGTLSPKSETTANDRMSWAREAEKKARKLMGGN